MNTNIEEKSQNSGPKLELSRRLMLASALAGIPLVFSIKPVSATIGSASAATGSPMANNLVVDAHTHVFNAEDVPLFGFATHIWVEKIGGLVRVAQFILSPIGLILDAVIQLVAPGHKNELQKLKDYNEKQKADVAGRSGTNQFIQNEDYLPQFDTEIDVLDIEDRIVEATDGVARRSDFDFQLRHDWIKALEDNNGDVNIFEWAQEKRDDTLSEEDWNWLLDETRLTELRDEAEQLDNEERQQILGHSEAYEDYLSMNGGSSKSKRYVGPGILKFAAWFLLRGKLKGIATSLKRLISYRSTNAKNLIKAFKKKRRGDTSVDVFVSALVDFDKWSGNDESKYRTSIKDQIQIMAELSQAFKGQILPFVAFDPWRQVETTIENKTSSLKKETPLDLVKDAIENKGFVGVKLYPQLGFRPHGNWEFDALRNPPWPHRKNGFNPRTVLDNNKGFGCLLDDALIDLYKYCVEKDVPILTHGNDSLGTRKNGSDCGNPKFWKRVLDCKNVDLKSLRLNIGHMGGFEAVTCRNTNGKCDSDDWTSTISDLVKDYPNVYSDLSNFEPIVKGGKKKRNKNKKKLLQALRKLFDTTPQGIAGMKKLMYGSDWHMPINKGRYREYFDSMESIGGDLIPGNKENFNGGAAVNFLGLRTGSSGARSRLNDFYKDRKMSPEWTQKI